jgi:hypothetical protein
MAVIPYDGDDEAVKIANPRKFVRRDASDGPLSTLEGMTTTNDVGQGAYQRVTDPSGTTYLLQVAPSGYLQWSVYIPQNLPGLLWQTAGAKLANLLVFRGSWTVIAWRSDVYAPKRERLHKERYPSRTEAVATFDRLAATLSAGSA